MANLKDALKQKQDLNTVSTPQIFNLRLEQDRKKVEQLFIDDKVKKIVDDYPEQLREYFSTQNPTLVFQQDFEVKFTNYLQAMQQKSPLEEQGNWVYYPWLFTLVHILEEQEFFTVRTARNRNLITTEEQNIFYNAKIGIAGLSVGNSVALAIALQGGAKHLKLADFDRLALSNTNRIRVGIESLGQLKCEITAKQIYTINPYAQVEIFTSGLTPENIGNFFSGTICNG